ncbi:MAG: hypothetical protein AAFQ66_06900 [Pseudomonadota bacterium]
MLRTALAAGFAALVGAQAIGATATIDAQTNIFLASESGTGGGLAPSEEAGSVYFFDPGEDLVLTFSSVTGETRYSNFSGFFGPDGNGGAINITSSGGIAGMRNFRRGFLAGAFLNSEELPTAGNQPSRANYTLGTITNQDPTFEPQLNQTFFIGDGVNEDGETQLFFVPEGADILVLGFLDGASFVGQPQNYFDNEGTLEATFSIDPLGQEPVIAPIPLPATLPLLLAGGLGLAALRRFRRG